MGRLFYGGSRTGPTACAGMDDMIRPDLPSEDLAALRARVEELEWLESQHDRMEEAISRLAARIAHDINHVMSAILASTTHLSAHLPADHAARSAVDTINRAVEAAMDLTRSLLDFSRNLPALREPVAPAAGSATTATPVAASGTILLAEDDSQIRDLMASVLEAEGHEVVRASDGTTAMDHHGQRAAEFSLLILDLDLPGISGQDCLHEIRSTGSQVPVILATGDPGAIDAGELDANTAVLAKPFQMKELSELAAALISKARRHDDRS